MPQSKVARRQARSREQEEAFLKGVTASIEESTSNPWARVCDLVDLQKPIVPLKSASSFSSTGAGAGASGSGGTGGGSESRRGSNTTQTNKMEEEDVFRATEKMRSLIIQVGDGHAQREQVVTAFVMCRESLKRGHRSAFAPHGTL